MVRRKVVTALSSSNVGAWEWQSPFWVGPGFALCSVEVRYTLGRSRCWASSTTAEIGHQSSFVGCDAQDTWTDAMGWQRHSASHTGTVCRSASGATSRPRILVEPDGRNRRHGARLPGVDTNHGLASRIVFRSMRHGCHVLAMVTTCDLELVPN